jgi:serine-type D-Ala-D-Ala carboxypeptidase (penicillin-binding protein 5/6)
MHARPAILTCFLSALCAAALLGAPATAPAAAPASLVPPAPAVDARAAILMDAYSGRVLATQNADARVEPASLTKLMTAYVVFNALREGKLKLNQMITISTNAWKQEGSRTFVQVGTQVQVEDLIKGMIIQSGNDATVALAEAVAGTEPTFAKLMNLHAKQLGMANSNWENASGLPGPQHYTTARDLALLSAAVIREFPQQYRYYSMREFSYGGITQQNRNGLLDRDSTVDGIKTGHTASAGYCLASSAQRDGMRLVAVVLGSASPRVREDASAALLNWGFSFYESRKVFAAGKPVRMMPVFKGAVSEAGFGVRRDLWVTVPRGDYAKVRAAVSFNTPLVAPLVPTAQVGKVTLLADGQTVGAAFLYPVAEVKEGGFLGRAWDSMRLWFQ